MELCVVDNHYSNAKISYCMDLKENKRKKEGCKGRRLTLGEEIVLGIRT
jgi:hypothetical protein